MNAFNGVVFIVINQQRKREIKQGMGEMKAQMCRQPEERENKWRRKEAILRKENIEKGKGEVAQLKKADYGSTSLMRPDKLATWNSIGLRPIS